jgi:hypothetical protein
MKSGSADGLLKYKILEQIRGFLCHLAMTYLLVTPYLKGLHLTLASHHPGCDAFGWKMASKEWAAYLFEVVESGKLTGNEAESMTRAAAKPTSSKPEDREPFPPPKAANRKPLWHPPSRIKAASR